MCLKSLSVRDHRFIEEIPQLSLPVSIGGMLQPPDHLCSPPLDLVLQLHILLIILGAPELNTVLQVGGLMRVEWRRRITCLDLVTTLLLMQPRMQLAFCAASAHC